jgi:hypothetical protein
MLGSIQDAEDAFPGVAPRSLTGPDLLRWPGFVADLAVHRDDQCMRPDGSDNLLLRYEVVGRDG